MLRKSLENQPYISPILSLANITLLNDSYAEAEALARMSLQLEGSNLLGMTTLGVALIYQKKFDEAIEWLYAALEVD
jgi:tetratricopeptide (TPR) repeat protein